MAAIAAATADLGIALDLVGRDLGRLIDDPERRLPDYDIVFASGRKALEALVCGCIVVIADAATCDEMVTVQNFERVRAAGYLPIGAGPPDVEWVRMQLQGFSGADARQVAEESAPAFRLPRPRQANRAELSRCDRENGNGEPTWVAEQLAVSSYLQELSMMTKTMLWLQTGKGDLPLGDAALFADASASLAAIQASSDRLHWWPDQRSS